MMKASVDQSCALLVLSCDAYADLWVPFFHLLRRHWPDCPYRVYLGTGALSPSIEGITVLHSNAGRDWSGCLDDYLGAIETSHVLIMLDDFFLRSRVDTALIDDCLRFVITSGAAQLRLIPRPGPRRKIAGQALIGECPAGMRYRVCAQAAIWNRVLLRGLIVRGESAWQFEHNATERALAEAGLHCATRRSVLPYVGFWAHHVVEKGCWLPHEKALFADANIGCDFTKRKTLPLGQTILLQMAVRFQKLLWIMPSGFAEILRRLARRLFGFFSPKSLRQMGGR